MRTVARTVRRLNPLGLAAGALLASVWELAARTGLLDFQYLPAPSAIVRAAGGLLASGELPFNALHTLTVTLVGWVAASVAGIGLGLLLGLSPLAYRYSITSFEVTRAVPPIAFVPAALLLFGFSLEMELVVVTYVGVWPVLVNTIGGVRAVPAELLDVARMLRMPRWRRVRTIVLPAAMPAVIVGLRLALTLCLVLAVVAEMVGNPDGLGHALVIAQHGLQPEEMFAYVVATGVLGVVLNAALRSAAARALPSSAAGRSEAAP